MPSYYSGIPYSDQKKRGPKGKILTVDQINEVHDRAARGQSRKKIAEEMNISYYLIKKQTHL
jgi:DNA-binding NarL/FixJ family response regulator